MIELVWKSVLIGIRINFFDRFLFICDKGLEKRLAHKVKKCNNLPSYDTVNWLRNKRTDY